ncbi:MAG: NAD(P)H-dependent oxidoreductase [Myxococcota bacterium]|nr:NAD(P)H-dependent oxidoreductase [Myxococcota bacterium]
MTRIAVANGAPRKTGYTYDLLALLAKGITSAGGALDMIHLCDYDIRTCVGCYHCWHPDHPGTCVHADDMPLLADRYAQADLVVFATPLYFYSFSAILKVFIERLLPLTEPRLVPGPTLGLMQNALRSRNGRTKRSALMAVAALRDPRGMHGLEQTFELISDGLHLIPSGKLFRSESFFLDFPGSSPRALRKIQAAFETAGRELVTCGHIRPETQTAASMPLTRDAETYQHYSEVYWQVAADLGIGGGDRDALRERVSEDLRILMPEFAALLDPAAAADLAAVVLFDLTGNQAGKWHFVIANGTCRAIQDGHNNPTLTIKATSEILLDIIRGRSDPRTMMAKGDLNITGDTRLAMRFNRLFATSKPR